MTRKSVLLAATAALMLIAGLLALSLARSGSEVAEATSSGIVVLTFDTEQDPDAEVLASLGVDKPATYFFTGSYAQAHPDLVRRLAAEGNTIGSHSFYHDDLTTLSDKQLHLDLDLSRRVIEGIACTPVLWFRAPFLETNDASRLQVAASGYGFDSSDRSGWPRDSGVPGLPVSAHQGRLVSDFDIYEKDRLNDDEALRFLIEAYDQHASHSLPFVFLMHPRLTAPHAEVLHAFLRHVEESGGRFMTAQGYADSLIPTAPERRLIVQVDLGSGVSDIGRMVSDLSELGATDALLSVADANGQSFLDVMAGKTSLFDAAVAELRSAGIRAHAWLPVLENPTLAEARPDLAMIQSTGTASDRFLSPSHPEVRQAAIDLAVRLVREHDIDGIYLDPIRYPNWNFDFSPAALDRFAAASKIAETEPETILAQYYDEWVNWHTVELEGLTAEIAAAVRAEAGATFEVSASLSAEAAVAYRSIEASGQDYRLLGPHLDFAVLKADPADEAEAVPLNWRQVLFGARSRLGPVAVMPMLDTAGQPRTDGGEAPPMLDLEQILALSDGAVLRYEPGLPEPDAKAIGRTASFAGAGGPREAGWLSWLGRDNEPAASWMDMSGRDPVACSHAN